MYELTLSIPPRTKPILRDGHVVKIRTPTEVAMECGDLAHSGQEVFAALYVNSRNNLIDKRLLGIGTLDSCLISVQEVFSAALLCRASAVIIVHQHPSGNPTPSSEDLQITRKLIDGGKILGINVLDHVILAHS
jgi:DNA repair protein RadC